MEEFRVWEMLGTAPPSQWVMFSTEGGRTAENMKQFLFYDLASLVPILLHKCWLDLNFEVFLAKFHFQPGILLPFGSTCPGIHPLSHRYFSTVTESNGTVNEV